MPIRKVTTSDLDDIAHVCGRGQSSRRVIPCLRSLLTSFSLAFQDDILLGDMMHPHRAEYPQDFIDYFRRRAQRSVNDKSHVLLVSFQNDSGTEIITGFADWVRQSGHASPEDMLSSTTDQRMWQWLGPDSSDVRHANSSHAFSSQCFKPRFRPRHGGRV